MPRSRSPNQGKPDHPRSEHSRRGSQAAVSQEEGLSLDFDSATFYVGHETIVASDPGSINRIPEMIFSYLNRNAVHEERHYGMPPDQIVEIGTQIDL